MASFDRKPMLQLRYMILTTVIAGVLLGETNSLSNGLGSPWSPHSLRPGEGIFALELLAAIIGTAWAWALLAFILGWLSADMRLAPLMGSLALTMAAVTYYVSDFAIGLNDDFESYEMVYWVAVSLVVGPVMGLLGSYARSSRWWSLAAGLSAPAIIAITNYPAGSDHIQPWPQRVAWILAVGLTVAITFRWLHLRYKTTA